MDKRLLESNPSLVLQTVHAYAINDFEVEDDIKQLINENAYLVRLAPPEETYKTFCDIMITPNPATYIREFKEVFFALVPGLKETYGFDQKNPWHIYDVFEHTMHVVENTSDNLYLRIAALFHDLGKPKTYREETKKDENGNEYQIGHFFGHPEASKIIFNQFAFIYKIPAKDAEIIKKLIIYHDYHLSKKIPKVQAYIEDLGVENVPLMFELKRADNLAQNLEKSAEVLGWLDEYEAIFNQVIEQMGLSTQQVKRKR